MTLKELAEQAQKLLADGVPADSPVYADGCDCTGAASGLVLDATSVPVRYEDGPLKGKYQKDEHGHTVMRTLHTVLVSR